MPSSSNGDTLPFPLKQHIPTLLFIAVTALTSTLVGRTQAIPYLDEIFHIPQAKRYCAALASTSLLSVNDVWQKLKGVSYDEGLTTPPGLYAISVVLAKVLPGWECKDTIWLRATNLVLLLTLPTLVARILRQNDEQVQSTPAKESVSAKVATNKTNKAISRRHIESLQAKAKLEQPPTPNASHDDLPDVVPPTIAAAHGSSLAPSRSASTLPTAQKRKEATPYFMAIACTICFLPPLWFFGFLYYTDLASIWLVLAILTLYNDLNAALDFSSASTGALISLASILAVSVRQNNIVWIGFAAAQAALASVGKLFEPEVEAANLPSQVGAVLKVAFGEKGRHFWKVIAVNAAPMAPVLAVTAWFLRWNGSIVLGDKSAHQVALHLPHVGYFLAFASLFGFAPLLYGLQPPLSDVESKSNSTMAGLAESIRQAIAVVTQATLGSVTGLLTLAAALIGFYIAADQFTIEHPYLLSDNRHYPSYVWRRFRKSYTLPGTGGYAVKPKFVVVPLFALALIAWSGALTRNAARKGTGALFNLLFWLATSAALVPTPLIEPRYFLMSYILLRIFSHPKGARVEGEEERRLRWVYLALEVATYAAVNAITVGLFVLKPFEWPESAVNKARGEGTTMRYLW
ncbi:alpha-1,2 glucosyltransferase [Pseudozyma hubeiensis SY62]|uniref:Dol-P-Glc:Glc(2)Man(9)GlcNAc(2)-PP-Dol alpha-1,2-glucosyltransferase n=1 Tax=Pseudozyma hubeiensis (strain SY62) TaxID=1305764 RepID=R9P2B8_PSEHS|nr:alpha-1,2 glucosyltransferase [Pseudozyma hubeiensis SY62]GAC95389.1 alpha-1,2 glucosyltransferase [Pseudozyma hubeiensis SY62]